MVALIRMSCYGARCVLRDPAVAGWPEILEIHRITGDACSVLKVAATSMDAFEAVIDRLAPYGRPSSTMVLSTPLAWRPLTPPQPLTFTPPAMVVNCPAMGKDWSRYAQVPGKSGVAESRRASVRVFIFGDGEGRAGERICS